jgi:mRNA interferase MazF
MVTPSAGAVVLVPFPFADLSQSKLRPAVVLDDAGKGDYVLFQITNNVYSDSRAIEIKNNSFASGSLRVVSYARPSKLFTASHSLLVAQVGTLKDDALKEIVNAAVELLRAAIK